MLASIQVEDFGAYKGKKTIDVGGVTRIEGPSQSGKSTLSAAITFCLWGEMPEGGKVPVDIIHHGAKRCSVTLTWANGVQHQRTMTKSRSQKRYRIAKDSTTEFSTEKDWRERLGLLGRKHDVLRHLVSPMAWLSLADGKARPLRDLLASVLPEVDHTALVSEMMTERDQVLNAEHADWSEKDATMSRKTANADEKRAEGAEQAAIKSVERLGAPVEIAAAVVDTEAIKLVAEWDQYDTAMERNGERLKDRQRAEQNRKDYRRRLKDIGEHPGAAQTDAKQAAKDAAKLKRRATETGHAVSDLRLKVAGLEPKAVELPETATWNEAGDILTVAVDEDSTVEVHLGEEEVHFDSGSLPWPIIDALVAWRAERDPRLVALRADLKTAETAHTKALTLAEQCQAIADKARAHADAITAYQRAIKALGPRPAVPDAPPEPTAPAGERPTAEDVAKARDADSARQKAQGASEQRAADLAAAETSLEEAQATLAQKTERATYWRALVEVIREAPSRAVSDGLTAMGDLGPVTITVGVDPADPAVAIEVDGLPWSLTSSGRKVVADAYFRAGLRRAAGLGKFPLVIDDTSLVGGQPQANVSGPKILMVTTHGETLERVEG